MIGELVCNFGVDAIRYYRGLNKELEAHLPEEYISCFMARRINELTEFNAVSEQYFSQTAYDLDNIDAIAHAKSWEGKADITVYRAGKPCAIIEVKKFTDHDSPTKVARDKIKLLPLELAYSIDLFLAVYVTDDERGISSSARIQEVARQIGGPPLVESGRKQSLDPSWLWELAVWKLGSDAVKTAAG